MELPEQDRELIEKYIDGLLSPTEVEQLKVRLEQESLLAKELAQLELMTFTLREQDKIETKKELKELFNQHKKENKPTIRRRLTYSYLVAASVGLVAMVLSFYVLNTTSTPPQLFEEYYQAFPAQPITRNGNKNELRQAVKLYKARKYQEALPLLLKIIEERPDEFQYNLLVGSCYLSQKEFSLSEQWFKSFLNSSDPLLKMHSQWYLAMTYLAQSKLNEAVPLLRTLARQDSAYQQEAQILLEKLDSFQ